MINNTQSPLNSTVQTLYNGVVALSAANEISADIASALATPLAEIKGDGSNYHTTSPAAAIRKLEDFVDLVNQNYPSKITLCAQTNLVRGAEFLIDAIEWSVANRGAVRPADLLLPWGVCPWPVAVSNLTVVNNGATANVSFYYEPNANYFWIFQVLPNGTLAQLLGMIDSNNGVPGGDGAPSGGTRSFTVPVTADPNLNIMVRVCGGLHCADQTDESVPTNPAAPVAPATLTAAAVTNGVQLVWPAVPGANEYRIYRDGVLLQTLGTGSTGFVDTTAAAGATHTYAVETCNTVGCSGSRVSATVSVVTPVVGPGCHAGGNNRDKLKCKTNNGSGDD